MVGPFRMFLLVLMALSINWSMIVSGLPNYHTLSVLPPSPNMRDPDIRIDLWPHGEADAGPGDDGIVQFPGTVYCEMPPGTPPGQFCTVYLSVECEDWPASTSSALTFDHNNTVQPFQVVVRVPPGTPAGDRYVLTVTGMWVYSPGFNEGTIGPAQATITVKPYSHLVMGCVSRSIKASVGDTVSFKAHLKSEGNTPENISIYCVCPAHVSAELDLGSGNKGPNVVVRQGGIVPIAVNVRQDRGLPGNRTIWLHARGTYTSNYSRVNLTLFLVTDLSSTTFITSPHFWAGSLLILMIIGIAVLVTIVKVRKRRRKRMLARI